LWTIWWERSARGRGKCSRRLVEGKKQFPFFAFIPPLFAPLSSASSRDYKFHFVRFRHSLLTPAISTSLIMRSSAFIVFNFFLLLFCISFWSGA
jgi:hypothetical protein